MRLLTVLVSTVAVNGQIPGTLITAKKNDIIKVNVVNNLNDTSMAQGTSIVRDLYPLPFTLR